MNYDEKKELGNRLRTLREKAGKSQQELSKSLSVARNTIVNHENGSTLPNAEVLIEYKKYFKTSYSYLLDGEEIDTADLYHKFQSLSPKEKRFIKILIDGLQILR